MSYLFSSESVSEGHSDKVADQISDALVDQFLAYDEKTHCAIENFVTTGQAVIMGEVRSDVYIDFQTIARKTINKIGYTKADYMFDGNSCGILTAIHEQSDDINRGVSRKEVESQGAVTKLKLRQPMYLETAAYGHMGRKNETVKKTFISMCHEEKIVEVELFTWEKLDRVRGIKKYFNML